MSWRVAADIGGTFTDLVAWRETDGEVIRTKVLTTIDDPVRGVLGAVDKAGIDLTTAVVFVHGSTIAINAVLQGKGARTALLTTRGFRDVLEMGRKNRPDMYNLFFRPRVCPVPRELRFEVDERLDFRGSVLTGVKVDEVRSLVKTLPDEVEAVAICFLHSYNNPDHERAVANVVRETRGDVYISSSNELSRELREYERTSTTVVNAYVGPIVGAYIGRLVDGLRVRKCDAPLLITQSNGGVMSAATAVRQPVRTTESGPAAGVTGAAWLSNRLNIPDLIAFDMGGTTAKACVILQGQPEMSSEYYIGGHLTGMPVQVPFLDIVEVGAGGGSVAYADEGGGLRVGPRSAGSFPGPACYSLGGTEPTITDANVVVGKIHPSHFLGGEMALNGGAAEAALGELGLEFELDAQECARAVIRVANSIMANAIRSVTVERGRDPRDFTLVAYGGAGPVHAAALAADLMIPRVLIPSGSGTFAAFGMLVTDLRHDSARTYVANLDAITLEDIEAQFALCTDEALAFLAEHSADEPSRSARLIRALDMRYLGQYHPLTLVLPEDAVSLEQVAELFHLGHEERYGHSSRSEPIEINAVRVSAIREVVKPSGGRDLEGSTEAPRTWRPVLFDEGAWVDSEVVQRSSTRSGDRINGPAVIEDQATNVVLGEGDMAEVLDDGHVLITIGLH
jgi:N-methylhydantoinase A